MSVFVYVCMYVCRYVCMYVHVYVSALCKRMCGVVWVCVGDVLLCTAERGERSEPSEAFGQLEIALKRFVNRFSKHVFLQRTALVTCQRLPSKTDYVYFAIVYTCVSCLRTFFVNCFFSQS